MGSNDFPGILLHGERVIPVKTHYINSTICTGLSNKKGPYFLQTRSPCPQQPNITKAFNIGQDEQINKGRKKLSINYSIKIKLS